MKSFPRLPLLLLTVVALSTVAGCSSADDRAVPVPTPSGDQAKFCRALHKELPSSLDGMERKVTKPASDFTAAWGDDSPIVLRCGVNRPRVVTPREKHYNPNTDTVEVNGVEWLPEEQPDGSVRCTTSKRVAWVEVTLPKKYTGPNRGFGLLVDLAEPVKKSVPFGII
ncbi:DUF3515 domain-containing protein [Streptomyces sp. NPDC057654]|uniref:DUF3515 domain-containing protein n=1 Tax=Streptomyces sp. NPDC057654 TaxID=3346196 RepID=UPI00368F8F56